MLSHIVVYATVHVYICDGVCASFCVWSVVLCLKAYVSQCCLEYAAWRIHLRQQFAHEIGSSVIHLWLWVLLHCSIPSPRCQVDSQEAAWHWRTVQEITFHCRLTPQHSFTLGPGPLLHSHHAPVSSPLLASSVDLSASCYVMIWGQKRHCMVIKFVVPTQETEHWLGLAYYFIFTYKTCYKNVYPHILKVVPLQPLLKHT